MCIISQCIPCTPIDDWHVARVFFAERNVHGHWNLSRGISHVGLVLLLSIQALNVATFNECVEEEEDNYEMM